MKIFPTTSIKQLDADTIENEPIASIDLMERASRALARAIAERWEPDTPLTVFAGPGNNGGDALALARLLAGKGYRLEGYLFKDAKNNQVYVYDAPRTGAKTAVTEYKTIASDGRLTLVECRLITGRTHQIRAQFRHAGCSLLGDGKYGREKDNRAYGEKGQALCSWRLRFVFDTPAGELEYLNGKSFRTKTPEFVEKYFPTFAERMKT